MASCLRDTEERSNGSKLSRLLIDGGTEAQRRIFDRFHPPSTLATSFHAQLPLLTHLRHKKILNNNQWDKLFPPSGVAPDSKGFDITLLFVLLRNICGLAPPATGWNSLPLITDTTLEANLARIKYYRNQVYGHVSSTELSRAEFEHYWKEISGALVALGLDQISIEVLKSSPLGTTDYLILLADWSISDHTVKEITEETKKEIHKTRQTTEETRKEVNKIRLAAEEAKNAAELLKKETAKTQRAVKESACKIDKLVEKVNDMKQPSQVNITESSNDSSILSNLFKYNFTGHINFLFNRLHPGTRKWMLGKLWQHLNNEQSQCVVVTAQPGIGKSVLAAVTCKTLQDRGQLAACHFIQHDNCLTNNPRLIIESIAVKMCGTIPEFQQKLEESLSRNSGKELSNMNCKELFTLLLENPVNALGSVRLDREVVVIDALDECDPKQKEDFVKALFSVLPKLPKWFKFLITTRPVTGMIPNLSTVSVIDIVAENENNTQDIKLYLTSQLCALYKDSTLKQVDDAVTRLAEKCGGIFLVAHFVVDCVKDQQTDLLQIHELFPKGISSVYEEYFKCVVTEIEVEEERFFSFLEAIVAAQNPLPETLVLHILGLRDDSHDDRKTARRTLRNLSNLFPPHGGHITIFHKSIFDWLTKGRYNSEQHYFSVKIKDGHRVLAEHCLEYLQDVKGYNSFPPSVKDCERYALRFGFQHMLMAGCYEERLSECVNSLEVLSAQYCTSSDDCYGMRNLCNQLESVTNVFSSDELCKFIRNLKQLSFVSCRDYPQAVLQAAVFCSFSSNQRKQAVQLLDTPKYNFGYVAPTQRHWDLPEDYRYIFSFQVSLSTKVAACIGSTKSHNFFAATLDVDTGKCIALALQEDQAAPFSTSPVKSKTRLSTVRGGWRPVQCAISPNNKYVAVVTFFNIELRLVSSLQVKKTFAFDSEPNTCCFLPYDGKLVAGYCDSVVRVWTLGWRTAHLELRGHSKRVTLCTAASLGPVLTGDECGSVIVWHSLNPPSSIKIINGGSVWRWNRSTTISPDGSRIAALRYCENSLETNSALEIALFSSADGKLLATIPMHSSSPSIQVFIDNVRLVVGTKGEGYILSTDSGHIQRILFQPMEGMCRRYSTFKRLRGQEYVARVDEKLLLSFKLCNIK